MYLMITSEWIGIFLFCKKRSDQKGDRIGHNDESKRSGPNIK